MEVIQYSTKTKLHVRLSQSYVPSTLLQSSECWTMTERDLNKLSIFHTKNLGRILRRCWRETISNQHLLACCNQDSMGTIIMKRQWRWPHTALHWPPEGKWKWGWHKKTWCQIVEGELRPSVTLKGPFRSWPRTDRSGVPLLLPYMPASMTGMSEWVSSTCTTVLPYMYINM